MSKIIEPLRGVHDVLPAQIAAWQHLERITREVFAGYGYEEFRVPVIEQTQLFKRSIGDFTDIVEKEMFSFVDQGEDHITLRPEATAGIVRAVISNGLLRDSRLRVSPLTINMDRLRDIGQIAHTCRRHDRVAAARKAQFIKHRQTAAA